MAELLKWGLIKREGNKWSMGTQTTMIDRKSPFARSHHSNWRNKSIERLAFVDDGDFIFTSPMTLSEKDFQVIRQKLLKLIEEVIVVAKESPSERLVCLNIDWFKLI